MAARRCSDFTLEAIGDQPAFAEKIMTSRPSRSNLRSSVIPNFSITRADARFAVWAVAITRLKRSVIIPCSNAALAASVASPFFQYSGASRQPISESLS